MKLSGIYARAPYLRPFYVGDPKRWKSVSSQPHLEISSGNGSLLEQSSLGQRLMGDQADPDADYAAKVLAFDEDDIEDYASVVKKYFEEGSSMNIKTLQALLRSAGVDRTQGCVGRYTRA